MYVRSRFSGNPGFDTPYSSWNVSLVALFHFMAIISRLLFHGYYFFMVVNPLWKIEGKFKSRRFFLLLLLLLFYFLQYIQTDFEIQACYFKIIFSHSRGTEGIRDSGLFQSIPRSINIFPKQVRGPFDLWTDGERFSLKLDVWLSLYRSTEVRWGY